MPVGKKERGGEEGEDVTRGRACAGSLVLRLFSLSCRGNYKQGFQQNIN